jgi:hypothetical protein
VVVISPDALALHHKKLQRREGRGKLPPMGVIYLRGKRKEKNDFQNRFY